MIGKRLLALLACLLFAGPSFADGAKLPLAKDGQALCPIVISPKASPGTTAVAKELADYLQRITGATFTVQTGDGTHGIVLGNLAEFPDAALNDALAVRDSCDGREAFALRTDAKRLRLLGATDLGASHAAFRFVESLGCRWFFPAKEWEVIPSLPTLTVAVNETDRPAILSRRIWWGYGFFDRNEKRCQQDYEAWARHNRMAQSRKIWTGHAWQSIILDNKKTFEEHPEYLALVKGKRQGEQFCVSNPEVRRLAARWALKQLERRPELDMVSMETSDGGGHCECEACKKLGNVSDRAFGLANEVAREVARRHPGKMVGMLAYNDHCEPPSFPLEPNVYVQSTAGFIRGKYTFDELMELWPKVCKNLGFYEYFSVWLWDFDLPPGGNGANLKHIRERFNRYANLGATSIDCESGNNWGLHGRGYYVANKLMWDPKADVDALLTDFYAKAFGPAADVLKRYYERLDPGNEPLLSEHLLALALRDLDEASRLAKDRPDVLARLDQLKQYQHYVRLRWDHDRAKDKQAKRDLAVAALTHVYRTRYSYMNHWAAMWLGWTPRAAKEFNEPALDWRSKDAPWRVATAYSREETEQAFRDDLKRFQPRAVQEVAFSADLVPVRFDAPAPAASRQQYQRAARYALFSKSGEPLDVEITTGIIAWYRDRADLSYRLTDAQGKEVTKGRLPQDGQKHALTLKVPTAGLYWLDANDQAAGWALQVGAGRPVSLALRRGSHPLHLGHMQRMFFYVPKGTKQIDYYWKGAPHQIHGPDGKLVQKVTSSGAFVSVPVPPGSDGKPWSFTQLGSGHLWLFNAPNQIAASPQALLVPREVAAKDGLAIDFPQ